MTRPVFVSYSQSDRDMAFEVVARLEARGLACWVAPRDIAPSAEWAAEIIEAISAARIMVLIFSRSSNDSPQVRREVERAVHKNVPIIALRIDDVLPERSLEYFLSAQHWLDAFPAPRDSHFDKLFHDLRRALDSGNASIEKAVPARAPYSTAGAAPRFAASVLLRFERPLARELGPIAKLLVTRAAERAASLEELRGLLAEEIESEQGRRQFIASTS